MTVSSSSAAKAHVLPIPKPERAAKRSAKREALYTYAVQPLEVPSCWLAQFSEARCDGRLERAHLIRAQKIRGLVSRDPLVVWDNRVWRWACHRHHVMRDQQRTLRVPRSAIPAETERWAADNGLLWWLDAEYGERAA